jgi:phosphatidylglycerol:prolipoprotein diacylglycerol transferase
MHPYLLDRPPVASFGAMIVLGLIAAWWLARRLARHTDIAPTHMDLLTPVAVAAGIGGAFVLGWVEPASLSGDSPHGRVLYGSLLAGTVAVIAYALIARLPLGQVGDVIAPSLAVGIAFGRVGCFLAGCCWGDLCVDTNLLIGIDDATRARVHSCPALSNEDNPLAVRFGHASHAHWQHAHLGLIAPDGARSLPVHPVQLYEAGGAALLAAACLAAFRRRRVWGEAFLLFAGGYAGLRFGLEYLRADNRPLAAGLTLSQWVCAAVLITTLALFTTRRRYADALRLRVERSRVTASL